MNARRSIVRWCRPILWYQTCGTCGTSSAMATRTRSASEPAFILRITWPRCAFTVISLMPSSNADLLVQQAGDDQRHDLPFARRERRVDDFEAHAAPPRARVRCGCARAPADGAQQHVVVERLGQELDGARLHRLHRHRHVAVAGDEDDRHVRPVDDALLQIETVEVGKSDVEHQAARNRRDADGPGIPAPTRTSRLPAGGANQQLQRFAHGDVVVDDEHDGRDGGGAARIALP